MTEVIAELKNITKYFGHFRANYNLNLTLKKGEVHALLGENGAGKSTLMNIFYGIHRPSSGEILVRGHKVNITDPIAAIKLGIGMVHQHFMLIDPLTVAENIVLGMEPRSWWGKINREKAAQDVKRISKEFGLEVDPHAKIEDLSVGMQQRVEILKTLYRGAEIIILDEPTAVLTPQEIIELGVIIKRLTAQGKSIVIITHKLKEIKNFANLCTVIRKGEYVDTVDVSQTSEEDLAALMVGRKVNLNVSGENKIAGPVLMTIKDLYVLNDRRLPAVTSLNLDIHSGEILGIAGVDGNGQHELVEALIGVRKAQGSILHRGDELVGLTPREIAEKKVACIPEDRQKNGLVLDFSISENSILKNYHKNPQSKWGLLDPKEIVRFSKNLIARFDVRPPEENKTARQLSGGNQQKVIIGRELALNPDLLIACQPTRGLDVGAIEYVHQALIEQRNAGKAVMLFSLELDEVLNLSDRIAVISGGKIVKIFNKDEANEKNVGFYMGGGRV